MVDVKRLYRTYRDGLSEFPIYDFAEWVGTVTIPVTLIMSALTLVCYVLVWVEKV